MDNKIIKVLWVIGSFDIGGVQLYLLNILRNINRDLFHFDIVLTYSQEGVLIDEVKKLGARVFFCPRRHIFFNKKFKNLLLQNGPYDIIHSHVHEFGGYIFKLAKKCGILTRIAHSHTDTSKITHLFGYTRRIYYNLLKYMIKRYATLGIGCSKKAAESLFGPNWEKDNRWHVLYSCIDLEPFSIEINKMEVRQEFGIAKDTLVVGNIARFTPSKNHIFLLEIANEMIKYEKNIKFLLIGDGPNRQEIEKQADRMNLKDKIIFTGTVENISRLMLGAMDLFVFPSLFEGLPLVVLEAQAAGLPCFISDVITEEVAFISNLVYRLSLNQPAEIWAKKILDNKNKKNIISQKEAVSLLKKSHFNIVNHVQELTDIYMLSVFQNK